MLLIITPLIVADESFTFKAGEPFTLEIAMANANLSDCSICSCEYNLFYQNGSIFISEGVGTNVNGYCRYINTTNILGKYGGELIFNDGIDYGRASFEFEVTPSGQSGTPNIVFFLFIILMIYGITFAGFFGRNIPLTILGGMAMMFLGVYVVNQGLIIYRDDLTNYFSYLTIAIGAIFAFWAALEQLDVI